GRYGRGGGVRLRDRRRRVHARARQRHELGVGVLGEESAQPFTLSRPVLGGRAARPGRAPSGTVEMSLPRGGQVRHLGSLIVAAVFAPSVLILAGRGLRWFTEATTADHTDELALLFALAALGLAGILYALLTLPRFSPLGPMLAGGAYLGVGPWALADPRHLLATVPGELAGLTDSARTPPPPVSLLLAAPLLATALSARRWRGERAEVTGAPPVVPAGPPPPVARPARRPVPYPPQPTRVMPT